MRMFVKKVSSRENFLNIILKNYALNVDKRLRNCKNNKSLNRRSSTRNIVIRVNRR